MINIYHTQGWGNLKGATLVGTCETKVECLNIVYNFRKAHNSYYERIIDFENNQVLIDYGSHTQFLLVEGISYKEYTTPLTTCLWLDDERDPNGIIWVEDRDENSTWVKEYCPIECERVVWVKSYKEFVDYLKDNRTPDIICFDHDLGPQGTGYDAAKYLCDHCSLLGIDLPKFSCHSMNPVGKMNILTYLNTFKEHIKNNKK